MHIYDLSVIKILFAETLAEKSGSYIVEEIFARFPSLSELMAVREEELTSIKGIGKVRAKQIVSLMELSRKLNAPVTHDPYVIRSPKDAANLLIPEMRYLQQEKFVVIFLNTKNHVTAVETLFIGSINACIVDPRSIFNAAVRRSAAGILCVHNHPSGDPTPSQEDVQLTKRLTAAAEIIGVDLLDHIVVAGDSYVSMKERGLMDSIS